jgi:hypothetical protein
MHMIALSRGSYSDSCIAIISTYEVRGGIQVQQPAHSQVGTNRVTFATRSFEVAHAAQLSGGWSWCFPDKVGRYDAQATCHYAQDYKKLAEVIEWYWGMSGSYAVGLLAVDLELVRQGWSSLWITSKLDAPPPLLMHTDYCRMWRSQEAHHGPR